MLPHYLFHEGHQFPIHIRLLPRLRSLSYLLSQHDTHDDAQQTLLLNHFPFQQLVMPWPFCPPCRATLKVDSSGDIKCVVCNYSSNLANLSQLPSSTTHSADRPVPMWAKSDEEQRSLSRSQEPTRATVEEACIRCGAPEVGFYTLQLRSVDEGQTCFYECPDCKHTWSVNN